MEPTTEHPSVLRRYWDNLLTAARAFMTGPVVVDRVEMYWGHDDSQFSPPEYGNYIATSNGVYSCIQLRAGMISGLPLVLYKGTGKQKKEVTSGAARDLFDKVNPFWTFERLVRMTEMCLGLWGEAYWFLNRGNSGLATPTEIWWARPDRVKVITDPTNYVSGFIYELNGQQLRFSPSETFWLPAPNPIDEFAGLSPLAAARLAADLASAAMHSNAKLFSQGNQMAGIIQPPPNTSFTDQQAKELDRQINDRFAGVDKQHRWGVMRYQANFQQTSLSPKDAEFTESLKWSLEEICRAYGVPLDLLGGQRTYANVDASERGFWTRTLRPEARFIAREITEKILPMFGNEADSCEFDLTDVEALKEDRQIAWTITKEKIATSYATINEMRAEEGLKPVPWGDVAWMPANLIPVSDDTGMTPLEPLPPDPNAVDPLALEEPRNMRMLADAFKVELPEASSRAYTVPAYGSPEHVRLMDRSDRERVGYERMVDAAVSKLFRSQRQSVLARLTSERSTRSAAEIAGNPFDKATWIRTFRNTMRGVTSTVVEQAGQSAMEQLGSGFGVSFDIKDPNVIRAIESQVQRFAKKVNDTTYDMLRTSLSEGVDAGETIDELAARVRATMGDRIRSSGEVIARTEVAAASSTGSKASWGQSGVVSHAQWLSAVDDRTRSSHIEAHGQIAPLNGDFTVGGATGPGPGLMSDVAENANCRCVLTPIIDAFAIE